ncbi:MAG: undecaprenyldiphospho-muramoylpentapeptide beta-N-acetylglucosaminyltransferase [Proteobacteria bacterium]|nr:undecaprenyldiphospho-muramoylpentapeptide beta-N-acetylglucosaminyltransferase [Pseudomonadota bacterium]
MDEPKVNILIAGGGTGGHLFPGIAIARAFLEKNPENRILFVGTDRPFEKNILAEEGFDHLAIRASGIKGLGLFRKLKATFKIPGALVQSSKIIKDFNPDLIIGVGGYSSGPVALVGYLKGITVVLQEQNIIPGVTNRILSRFATRIHVSFGESLDYFKINKTLLTGNPVRQSILLAKERRDLTMENASEKFTVMVAGGSQGAHNINMALIHAVEHLNEKGTWHFIHQTGVADEAMVKNAYERNGISAQVQAFYNDMDRCYEKADLIVCRAGATSISEITVMGLAPILIPFPFATDDHQVKNAISLVKKGAAEMITEDSLNGSMLAQRMEFYRENKDERLMMAENSEVYGKPRAAWNIVDDCYELIKGQNERPIG